MTTAVKHKLKVYCVSILSHLAPGVIPILFKVLWRQNTYPECNTNSNGVVLCAVKCCNKINKTAMFDPCRFEAIDFKLDFIVEDGHRRTLNERVCVHKPLKHTVKNVN